MRTRSPRDHQRRITFLKDPHRTCNRALSPEAQELLLLLLDDPVLGMSWYYILQLAERLSTSTTDWFQRIAQTASNVSLERKELGIALLQCIQPRALPMPHLERAVRAGTFDSVIRGISRSLVLRVDGPMRTTFMTVMFAHVIQCAIKNMDLEDAYRELAASAHAFKDERPHAFEVWVAQVWRAYHNQGCVKALTKDDWRSTTEGKAVRFGECFSGNGEPCVRTKIVNIPEEWLWGPYTKPLRFAHPSAEWTPEERANASEVTVDGQTYTFMVDDTGARLRDLIHFRDRAEKERKVKAFCEHHGLEYPTP